MLFKKKNGKNDFTPEFINSFNFKYFKVKIQLHTLKICYFYKNSTLRYECDKTFSDECEFAA